ncbi:MAG: hypothetical protein K2L73_04405 [Muribaculaceae bacterium]|nr:hypothetical protein [Muribaculaceae bacterium]
MKFFKILATAALAVSGLAAPVSVKAAWGEWEEYCTATFDAKWWYRKPMTDLKVDRRVDTSNPDRVQYRVNGMFGEAENNAPVDLIINANFAVHAPTAGDVAIWIDDQKVETLQLYDKMETIYLCDAQTYYETYFPNNPEMALQYEDASYFRMETGTFHIYSYYHYADGTVPYLDAFFVDQAQGPETLRLISPEFKNYVPEFGSATFSTVGDEYFYNIPVTINDLSQVKMTVCEGEVSNIRPVCEGMNDGTISCITVQEDGSAMLPFAGTAGEYTLVYLTYRADGTPYQMGSQKFTFDPDWKSLGKAQFTDGFISNFLAKDMEENLGLNLPDEAFTYPVEIEENVLTPGLYRLVNPYGSTSPYWDINFSVVSLKHNENNYIVINAVDPERVFIEKNASGFYYGTYPLMLYSEAFDWLDEDYSVEQIPEYLWGKKENNTISFAPGEKGNALLCASIMGSPAEIYGRQFIVKLPDSSVEIVIDDAADAPVEYYNLQGIRIAEPAQGGIYIRRRGTRVEKFIAR